MIKPKDGDFVVVQSRWETAVRKVIRISASIYYYDDGYFNRERRARQDEIIFAGDEASAKLLCERLKSSEAQYQDECNKSILRREKRDAEFIAKASTVPSTHQNTEAK
jgi:hypothetical protein